MVKIQSAFWTITKFWTQIEFVFARLTTEMISDASMGQYHQHLMTNFRASVTISIWNHMAFKLMLILVLWTSCTKYVEGHIIWSPVQLFLTFLARRTPKILEWSIRTPKLLKWTTFKQKTVITPFIFNLCGPPIRSPLTFS
jgi:hypothetical protein